MTASSGLMTSGIVTFFAGVFFATAGAAAGFTSFRGASTEAFFVFDAGFFVAGTSTSIVCEGTTSAPTVWNTSMAAATASLITVRIADVFFGLTALSSTAGFDATGAVGTSFLLRFTAMNLPSSGYVLEHREPNPIVRGRVKQAGAMPIE